MTVVNLAYGYLPHTTGNYFETAFTECGCTVDFVGLSFVPGEGITAGKARPGFAEDVDVSRLSSDSPALVFFVDSGMGYFPRGLDQIDSPTAAYLIDVHRNLDLERSFARFFDHVFVAQRDYVELFDHPSVHWLPLACDGDVHLGSEVDKEWDVGFVGNVSQDRERHRKLDVVAEHFSTNDYMKPCPKEEIAEVYSRSRIVFNCAVGNEVNMRVFEAMASGSLLVTERVANGQSELFEDGVHLVEYSGDSEMIEKIRYYLEHDDERERIARAGQEAVLRDHTYRKRCDEILRVVADGPKNSAPVRALSTSEAMLEYARLYSELRLVEPQLRIARELSTTRGDQLKALNAAAKGLARRMSLITGAGARVSDFRSRFFSGK